MAENKYAVGTLTEAELDEFWRWVQDNFSFAQRFFGPYPWGRGGLKKALTKAEGQSLYRTYLGSRPSAGTTEFANAEDYEDALGSYFNQLIDTGQITEADAKREIDKEVDRIKVEGIHTGLDYYEPAVTTQKYLVAERRAESLQEKETARRKYEYDVSRYHYEYGGGEYGPGTLEERELQRRGGAAAAQRGVEEAQARREAPFDVQGQAGRAKLAEMVGSGRVPYEAAYGKGSEWEKWQHREMGGEQQSVIRQQQQRAEIMNQAADIMAKTRKALGDTPESLIASIQAARQVIPSDLAEFDPALGEYAYMLGNIQRGHEQRLRQEQGKLLSEDYPKWYEQFLSDRWGQIGQAQYYSPGEQKEWFSQWLPKQKGFEEAQKARETERYEKYPFLYPGYQQAGGLFGTKQTFPTWLQEPEPAAFLKRKQEYETRVGAGARRTPKWAIART